MGLSIILALFCGLGFGFEWLSGEKVDEMTGEEGHDSAISIDVLCFRLIFIWYKPV